MLRIVDRFTEKIKSMEEKINLSLFEEFFELSSPANYAKMLINTQNRDENKKKLEEIENRISDLKDRIERISEKGKKDKNADETLQIITKILDFNKDAQNFFYRASKVDKGKSEPKIEENFAERMKLRRQKLDIIANWFTDQISKALEIEDNVNLTLIIG